MRPMLTACERCGLREVRHELARRGINIRFCDECYWDELPETDLAVPPEQRTDKPAPSGRESK